MDTLLAHELRDAVFYDLPAFVDCFFPASEEISQLYKHSLQTGLYDVSVARWVGWPSRAAERSVLSFFQDLVDNQLLEHLAAITTAADRPIYRYVPSNEAPLQNGDCTRKTDVLLTTEAPSDWLDFDDLRDKRYDWGAVRVVGELKSNPAASDDKSTLLQVANYVREVFGAQPCRRAVHTFTLCGQYLRAWLFDRSGAICSTSVDINAEPVVFLRIICGYATMSARDLGFDPSIRWDRGGETVYDPTVALVSGGGRPYIYATIQPHNEPAGRRDSTAQDDSAEQNIGTDKLEIEPTPIYTRYAIVTRGSSCWKARPYRESPADEPWIYVVKDQWRAAERESECDIISAMVSQDNGRESDKRIGLPRYVSFGDHRENGELVDIVSTIRRGLVSAKKPPSEHSTAMAPPAKRQSAPSSHKRKAGEVLHSSSSKKLKFAQRNSALTGGPPECNNRIFSRLIMTPIGKSLYEFSSFTELLSALRDAIIGHKRLYHTYHILHRDVSINNIVISPPGHTSAGVLIDLDLAIDINRLTKSGASHRTGTQDFMAVGVLEGEPHRARHDLESFFFVLLWVASFYDASANRRFDVSGTVFNACNNVVGGDYEQVSMMKRSYVASDMFEGRCLAKMEDEVRAALGPLLEEWRSLLFPAQNEDALWDNMVSAVDRRLAALEKQMSVEELDDLGGAVSIASGVFRVAT
jgi:hypothetical protein